jgi:hypothetical protein
MPITFSVDNRLGIVRETWIGAVTAQDLRSLWTGYMADPEILALRVTYVDLRAASITFAGSQMRSLIKEVVDPVLQGREWLTAIVVSGPLQLGMSRQFQEFADHFSHDAIFFDDQDALEWLMRQRAERSLGRAAPWGLPPGTSTHEPH